MGDTDPRWCLSAIKDRDCPHGKTHANGTLVSRSNAPKIRREKTLLSVFIEELFLGMESLLVSVMHR